MKKKFRLYRIFPFVGITIMLSAPIKEQEVSRNLALSNASNVDYKMTYMDTTFSRNINANFKRSETFFEDEESKELVEPEFIAENDMLGGKESMIIVSEEEESTPNNLEEESNNIINQVNEELPTIIKDDSLTLKHLCDLSRNSKCLIISNTSIFTSKSLMFPSEQDVLNYDGINDVVEELVIEESTFCLDFNILNAFPNLKKVTIKNSYANYNSVRNYELNLENAHILVSKEYIEEVLNNNPGSVITLYVDSLTNEEFKQIDFKNVPTIINRLDCGNVSYYDVNVINNIAYLKSTGREYTIEELKSEKENGYVVEHIDCFINKASLSKDDIDYIMLLSSDIEVRSNYCQLLSSELEEYANKGYNLSLTNVYITNLDITYDSVIVKNNTINFKLATFKEDRKVVDDAIFLSDLDSYINKGYTFESISTININCETGGFDCSQNLIDALKGKDIKIVEANLTEEDLNKLSQVSSSVNIEFSNIDVSDNAKINNIYSLKLKDCNYSSNLFKALPYLSILEINNNQSLNIKDIANSKFLHGLIIRGCNFSSLEGISGLQLLTDLLIENSSVEDVNEISNLSNLEYLDLDGNRIKDISSFKKIGNLKCISLERNYITDFSSLLEIPNLEMLHAAGNIGTKGLKELNDKGVTTDITLEYDNIRLELEKKIIDELLTNDMDDYTKIKKIYEFVRTYILYEKDEDAPNFRSDLSYFALKNHYGVCAHYSSLFVDLLHLAGIDAKYVKGYARNSTESAHAWVAVELQMDEDGSKGTFYCDPTWDKDAKDSKEWKYFLVGEEHFDGRYSSYTLPESDFKR